MALIVLEATGAYQNLAVQRLQREGLPVAVVNPRQVRDLAKASGQLARTDRLDAIMIARYGQVMQPKPQAPKSPIRVEIKNMTRRRDQLVMLRQGFHLMPSREYRMFPHRRYCAGSVILPKKTYEKPEPREALGTGQYRVDASGLFMILNLRYL